MDEMSPADCPGAPAAFAATALLRDGISQLLDCDLSSLAPAQVTELLSVIEVQRRRLESVDQRVIVEISERGVAGEYARPSSADLLVELLRISPSESKARVGRSQDIGPRRTVTGEPLPPLLPAVAAAQREGTISAAHAQVITRCVERVPNAMAHEVAPVAERMLVEAAQHLEPRQLGRLAEELLVRIDPDGAEPREREIERRRGLSLITRADGSGALAAELTAETAAIWHAILDTLSAPVSSEEFSEPDDRSPAQRRHDAFGDAGRRLLRAGTRPVSGGAPATVLVTIKASDLQAGTGYARTAHDDRMAITEMLRMATEAEIVAVVLGYTGGILAYGRRRRLASCEQRRALAARDSGCTFPGCTRPPTWCEVHHVIPWHLGGCTDIDNLVLLCGFHHREFERRGWVVYLDESGVPRWIPPPWLDPDQAPRRNTAHHLPDFDFELARQFDERAYA